MKITTLKQLTDILEANGWYILQGVIINNSNGRYSDNTPMYLTSPWDNTIEFCAFDKEFWKGTATKRFKLGTIGNLRDGNWDYDSQLNIITNGLFTLRVK